LAEANKFNLEPFFTRKCGLSIEEIPQDIEGFGFALMSGGGVVLGEVDFSGVDEGFEAEFGEFFAGEGLEGIIVVGEGAIIVNLGTTSIIKQLVYTFLVMD
jgi:Na+-transporting NADH:ubiquinone oxidoreductase subunit NqrE